jgi:hypothetical protein
MFIKRCRLLLKRIYNSIIMFNEDSIAAAQLAQIFGSELLKVQNSARTDGGSTPQIVNMDPKQFLVGNAAYGANRKAEEQRIMQALQREAEAAFPIAQAESYNPQVAAATIPPQLVSTPAQPQVIQNLPRSIVPREDFVSVDVLERIAVSLERIANAVDKVDIKTKKKTIKRSKPKTGKQVLLNETTS